MNSAELSAAITEAVRLQTQRFIAFLPNLGAALLLVLIGWLLGRLARSIVKRICGLMVDWMARRPALEHGLAGGSLHGRIPIVVGAAAFWTVLLTFVAAAVEQLQIPALSGALSTLAYYAPLALAAILIALAGFIVGGMVNHWIATTLAPAGAVQAQMLGRLAQFGTVTIALIMAADQAGIRSTILIIAMGIVLATTLGGIALAFAIGCGPIVGNLVASHYVSKRFSKGQTATVGGRTGAIREITTAFVVLETDTGEALIPARKFLEEISELDAGAKS